MKDRLIICSGYDDTFRIYLCSTTNLVEEAKEIHGCWPTASAALGRTLTVGAILASMLKERQSLAIKLEGDGPLAKIVVEADYAGHLTGYVGNPNVYLKYDNGKLNVKKALGDGYLTVVKNLHLKEPFTSTVELNSGEIAEDFAFYFTVSEQVPTSVALGVLVGEDNSIKQAGGFVVQVLPNASEESIERAEEILNALPPVTELLATHSLEEIALMIASDSKVLSEKELAYKCTCSKQRFREGILKLDIPTLEDLAKEENITTKCHFCGKNYTYDHDDLVSILNVARRLKNV